MSVLFGSFLSRCTIFKNKLLRYRAMHLLFFADRWVKKEVSCMICRLSLCRLSVVCRFSVTHVLSLNGT